MFAQDSLVFLFFSLFLGAAVTFLLSRFAPDIPYTVVLFAIGIGLGTGLVSSSHDTLTESFRMWNDINPELLLFIFLPALLFGGAISLNFFQFKGTLLPSIILAGPGAAFCAFAIAGLAKALFPYNWNWTLCFLFGKHSACVH